MQIYIAVKVQKTRTSTLVDMDVTKHKISELSIEFLNFKLIPKINKSSLKIILRSYEFENHSKMNLMKEETGAFSIVNPDSHCFFAQVFPKLV